MNRKDITKKFVFSSSNNTNMARLPLRHARFFLVTFLFLLFSLAFLTSACQNNEETEQNYVYKFHNSAASKSRKLMSQGHESRLRSEPQTAWKRAARAITKYIPLKHSHMLHSFAGVTGAVICMLRHHFPSFDVYIGAVYIYFVIALSKYIATRMKSEGKIRDDNRARLIEIYYMLVHIACAFLCSVKMEKDFAALHAAPMIIAVKYCFVAGLLHAFAASAIGL